jgi:hypothetical protein
MMGLTTIGKEPDLKLDSTVYGIPKLRANGASLPEKPWTTITCPHTLTGE